MLASYTKRHCPFCRQSRISRSKTILSSDWEFDDVSSDSGSEFEFGLVGFDGETGSELESELIKSSEEDINWSAGLERELIQSSEADLNWSAGLESELIQSSEEDINWSAGHGSFNLFLSEESLSNNSLFDQFPSGPSSVHFSNVSNDLWF